MKYFPNIVLLISWLFMSVNAFAETITVSAASSLSDVFKEIAQTFEDKYPNSKVDLNFASSGVLLQQIIQGAPVDVFASADQESMDRAEAEKVIKQETRTNFTGNQLVLVTPLGAKLTSQSLQALTDNHIKYIAIGNPTTTPAGRYAKAALQQAGLWQKIEAKLVLAESARQSLSYVHRHEVDAGFVFATDVKRGKDNIVVVLTIPTVKAGEGKGEWQPHPITYPIAQITNSKSALALAFIDFVNADEGQAILAKYGFIPVN